MLNDSFKATRHVLHTLKCTLGTFGKKRCRTPLRRSNMLNDPFKAIRHVLDTLKGQNITFGKMWRRPFGVLGCGVVAL